MNSKEYISTGVLDLYAAGLLDNDESRKVEDELQRNPEIRTEYENILKTIYVSALPKLKSPPVTAKTSILNKLKDKNYSAVLSNQNDLKTSPINSTFRYLVAACFAFLLFSLGVNYYLWTKLKDAKNEIAIISDQKKIIVQEYEAVNRKLELASKDMEIKKDRSYKMIELKGLEKSPSSNVVAFWNPENKKVYIEVMSLPVPPPDKQYQLWAISNGKPVDAGVMDVDPSDKSLHEMKSMSDAQAFAVTLEPKGGSVNPTMDEMYVMGKLF